MINKKDISLIKREILDWLTLSLRKTVDSFDQPTKESIKIEEYLWKYLDCLSEEIINE